MPDRRPDPILNVPKILAFPGGEWSLAGLGRTTRSYAYIDLETQNVHDASDGFVISTGKHFSCVEIPGNPALQSVRVDAKSFGATIPLAIGQRVLIACSEPQTNSRLRARFAWVLTAPKPMPAPKPVPAPMRRARAAAPRRFFGWVCEVAPAGTFGFIQPKNGHPIFMHAGEFVGGGARLVVGEAVSYEIGTNKKGVMATAIQPA